METIEEIPGISADFVVLAVIWDEVSGPTILSKCPEEGLADPINIALQIYLSSVAVFGQHSQTTKIDFSLPLLSISSNHIVRVAFDSWPDTEVRGDERPFFLGFIMNRDKDKILAEFIQSRLWSDWMVELKEKRSDFNSQKVYDEIFKYYQSKSLRISQEIFKETEKEDEGYSEEEALKDLERSSELWTRSKDRSVLNTVLRSAYRLRGNDAGNAYFLAGIIFFNSGDYENAYESYSRATESFKNDSSPINENIGESMFNAAISAYRLAKFEEAQSNLILSSSFLKDSIRKARMFLYLAQTQFRLKDYENSATSFETANENALEADDLELAGQILSVYASRLQERASTSEASLKFALLELSAKQRDKAAEFFSSSNNNVEAGTSLVLASKTYQKIKNFNMAITKLEQASELYLKDSDFNSAGRALYEVIDLYKQIKEVSIEEIVELTNRATTVISSISDERLRFSLLAKVVKEKAKILESKREFREALINYEEFYSKSKQSTVTKDILGVNLAYANLLFQVENFKKAGELFSQIAKYLTSIDDKERANRVLKNANVSYKRSATSYLSAAFINIHELKDPPSTESTEILAIYLNQVFSMIEQVKNSTTQSESESNKQWIEHIIKSLQKIIYLLPENMKNEMLENIKLLT